MQYEILDKINSPADLKVLPKNELPVLASEIRSFLVNVCESRGGHLASNLGIVEITLAIHRVFNSPTDHIVFDVGHQSYVHKLITGRRELFDTLRISGGLSGFPSIKESVHDPFGTGHSSTSISASIGLATVDKLMGKESFTVCVLGDGAFTGGMIHEALNNLKPDLPIVIVLNENGMAISENRGSFSSYISTYVQRKKYRSSRAFSSALKAIPIVGKKMSIAAAKLGNTMKNILYSPSYFEKLGIEYIGVVDGHDTEKLEETMRFARLLKKPVIIHAKTTKGRGYSKAETNPSEYHSVQLTTDKISMSDVFADEIINLAEKDARICAVTPAMAKGTGLFRFEEKFPDRYFDTGIAEAHALTFSAALAASGLKPFVATYSTFLQRGYDNLIHDIALQNLPVKIIADRAGLSIGDGATHHGIFDVSFFSAMPNFSLFAPVSPNSLKKFLHVAAVADSPVAIRYSAYTSDTVAVRFVERATEYGTGIYLDFDPDTPPEYVLVTYGQILDNVLLAESFLKSKGVLVGVVLTEIIKPYGFVTDILMKLSAKVRRILYVEEGIENGGAGLITMNCLRKAGFDFSETEYMISAIDDTFLIPESPCDIYELAGISAKKIVEKILL